MPGLYPNAPFVNGSDFTPDLADLAFIAPIFDDQPSYLGHRAKIADSELSDTSGQIKDRVKVVIDNLKVSVVSGLTLNYTSGVVRLPNGTPQSIASNNIVVADNAVSYVWVDATGTVATGLNPPVVRELLARVTTVSGAVTLLESFRGGAGFPSILPVSASIRSFGGKGDQGDFVATNGQTLSEGEYYFNNFTVGSGIALNIDKLARIFCSGAVNIAGTINTGFCLSGGSSIAIVSQPNSISGGTVGAGAAPGGGELPSATYNHLVSPVGSGGGSGYCNNNQAGIIRFVLPSGGRGGGCFWIEAAGNINVTGTINAVGEAGSTGYANDATYGCLGGSGGGSGGLVLLKSLTSIVVTNVATINVSGGAGGAGVIGNSSGSAEPGSGGGGGRITLMAPSVNTTGATLNLSGGALGANYPPANPAIAGWGGVGGSFGGLGGHQQPYAAGNAGQTTIRLIAPVG